MKNRTYRPGGFAELDAETEVYVLFIAGVGIEVVGGPAVELVTLAEFASDEKAESDRSEAGRDPAYGLNKGRLLFVVGVLPFAGERNSARDRSGGVVVAFCGAKPHAMNDSSRSEEISETDVRLDASFVSSALLTQNMNKGCTLIGCRLRTKRAFDGKRKRIVDKAAPVQVSINSAAIETSRKRAGAGYKIRVRLSHREYCGRPNRRVG